MKKPDNIVPNDWKLLQKKYKNLDNVLKKINNNYPIQYLIGYVDFYGYNIKVNKHVLIPRYETESLVEKTLDLIKKLNLTNSSVLDIGTGSGCISIALKNEIPSLQVTALDISRKAIKLAKKNAKTNHSDINFINKNMYKFKSINKYDVIISNPPYIKETDIIDPKTKYEPQNAIYGGENGTKYYDQIFKIASNNINNKHLISLEIGEEEGTELKKAAKIYFPKDKIVVAKDLANKNRFMFIYTK
jgi:release factor glutamine methyltransferase